MSDLWVILANNPSVSDGCAGRGGACRGSVKQIATLAFCECIEAEGGAGRCLGTCLDREVYTVPVCRLCAARLRGWPSLYAIGDVL
jgi:hypothetical protein